MITSLLIANRGKMIPRILLLILAIIQFATPALIFSGGLDEEGFNSQQAQGLVEIAQSPAVPAEYAFAIWGVIYSGCLALAIYGLIRKGRQDALIDRIALPSAATFALCIAWLFAARFGPLWATSPIITGMLICAGRAFFIAIDEGKPLGWLRHLVIVGPLAIYTGWLTTPTFISFIDIPPKYAINLFGFSPEALARIAILFAGGLAVAIVIRTRAYLAYVLTLLWALIAIMVQNGNPLGGNGVSMMALIVAAVLSLVAVLVRSGFIGNVGGNKSL
jgi:hypothetical protein